MSTNTPDNDGITQLKESMINFIKNSTKVKYQSFIQEYHDDIVEIQAVHPEFVDTLIESFAKECLEIKKKMFKGDYKPLLNEIRKSAKEKAAASNSQTLQSSSTFTLSNIGPTLVTIDFLQDVQKRYSKLQDKVKLPKSKKMLEDIMWEYAQKCVYVHPCHFLIFDPDDKNYEDLMEEEDITFVKEYKKVELPAATADFNSNKNKYRDCVTNRDFLSKTQINTLDPDDNHDKYWLDQSIVDSIKPFNFPKFQDMGPTSEGKINQNLWDFVGWCYQSLGFIPCGGEVFSRATSEALNKKRRLDGEIKIVKKCAGLKPDVLLKKNDLELGAIEFKLKDKGANSTEELRERGFKCPFLLQCMLEDLIDKYPRLKHNITTSGYFIADHKLTPIIMDRPFKNISRIAYEDAVYFPRCMDKSFGASAMKVYIKVFEMKLLMKNTLDFMYEDDHEAVFD